MKDTKLYSELDMDTMILGSIKEILQNPKYFYKGFSVDYCHLTEEGERAILSCLNILGPRLIIAQEQSDLERSKQLMIDELKYKESLK